MTFQCRWGNFTCVADTGVEDLDSDFMRLWWCDLDFLNAQILASFPCNSGLLIYVNFELLERMKEFLGELRTLQVIVCRRAH